MGTEGKRRPVFFNLAQISLPVGALASIAHRVAGVILAVGLPFAVYALDLSLQDPRGYAVVAAAASSVPLRLGTVMLAWALAHHLLAGVRHLLMDVDIGSRLADARRSAWIVNVGGIAIALLAAAALP
ncbi:MAG: succinate dehydrogenase, cytochrome b556 subunit [Betaproteobacteria bacterium]|nr:succinate dehydrogenase, cytochrome b556 subunit [Betaproteobacteria bacterium]